MITIPIDNQVKFFDWQIKEIESERFKYLNTDVLDLEKNSRLFIGKIWGYDESKGTLILRFRKGTLPRLKIPLTLCYVKSTAGVTAEWDFTYEFFRTKHTEIFTFCLPVYYLKNDIVEDWRYVGLQGIEPEFLKHIREDLDEKKHPLIVLAEDDPPIKYLLNLRNYTKLNPNDELLNLPIDCQAEGWKPYLMGKPEAVLNEALESISKNKITIIQGPPGTGKTHLIASICAKYINENKKVCVTALTNKALIEVAEKPSLRLFLEQNKIFKTNLSGNEEQLLKGIQLCTDYSLPKNGDLALVSYYKFSSLLQDVERLKNIYDILIIEEASQSFLATLSGFANFGKKIIIVGDPMQLSPIVVNENKALIIDKNIKGIVEGLKTVSYNHSEISYRMRYTYRLTELAAKQTGLFYNNSLVSVSPIENNLSFKSNSNHLFCEKGGATILKLDIAQDGKKPTKCVEMIADIVKEILVNNPSFKIAVLTPFKITNFLIYDILINKGIDIQSIEIETIDRIQGLTSDITILLIPFEGIAFAFQENRFNVATSRAKRGTLIITDRNIDLLQSPSSNIKNFLASCKTVV